jgi:hypothetical protein
VSSETAVRPVAPRENCADVEDCAADATEIGHICSFGPICGTCIVYRPGSVVRGLLAGNCRLRPDRGTFACSAPICDSYIPRSGAPNAKGETASQKERLVALQARPEKASRTPRAAPARTAPEPRVRIPDGPVGELEMTREELKALIREAMDEERGGGDAPLAQKWQGGSIFLKPGNPELQAKELSVDALLHKVVMIRDRLRVLEQKLNGHPKLSDAEKVEMQSYVTKCYGSLTTLNVLFRDREDGFIGEKGDA